MRNWLYALVGLGLIAGAKVAHCQNSLQPTMTSRSSEMQAKASRTAYSNRGVVLASADGDEPPAMFRGGLVQQLRSITGSVLGGKEDAEKSDDSSGLPKPPPNSITGPRTANSSNRSNVPAPHWRDVPAGTPLSDPPSFGNGMSSERPSGSRVNPNLPVPRSVESARAAASRSASNSAPVARSMRDGLLDQETAETPAVQTPAAPALSASQSSRRTPSGTKSSSNASSNSTVRASRSPVLDLSASESDSGPVSRIPTPESLGLLDAAAPQPPIEDVEPVVTESGSGNDYDLVVQTEDSFPMVPKKPLPGSSPAANSRSVSSAGTPSVASPSSGTGSSFSTSPALPAPSQITLETSSVTAPTKPAADSLAARSSSTTPQYTYSPTSSNSSMASAATTTNAAPQTSTLSTTVSTPTATRSVASGKSNMRMAAPSVAVMLLGPTEVAVAKPSTYQVLAENTGDIELAGMVVRVSLPKGVAGKINDPAMTNAYIEEGEEGVTDVIWEVPAIAARGKLALPLDLQANEIRNFAVTVEWTLIPQSDQLQVVVQQPQLQLGLEGPSEVLYGQPQLYKLIVSNPGTGAAENVDVKISADPYGESSSQIGSIPPGGQRVVEVELTFQQRGRLKISAAATAAGNLASNSQIEISVQQAILTAKIEGPESQYHGTIGEYNLQIRNDGDIASQSVNAEITIPPGVSLVTQPVGARLVGNTLQWRINEIPVGQTLSVPLQFQLDQPGKQPIEFRCQGSGGAIGAAICHTNVEAISDLKLTVTDPPGPAPIGEDVVYELSVVNQGTTAALNVEVIAQFSDGIEPVGASGQAHQLVPGQVIFDPIPKIAAGQEVTLRVTAQASAEGMHRFRCEVRCPENEARFVNEESTRFMKQTVRTARQAPSGPVIR